MAAVASGRGWQTDEIDEEWVEASPSPPQTLAELPAATESLVPPDPTSLKAKRGSLRALGHSAPRGLPPSRQNSAAGETGSARDRVLSERVGVGNGHDSGLTGGRTWSGSAGGPVAGTFVVKDGVEDDRGAHLARNGFAPGKKDMFGPSALEKMFQPPSPPTQPEPTRVPSGPTQPIRRPSHAYAPVNPSRLSKSVTPSTTSGSTSMSLTLDQQPSLSLFADESPLKDVESTPEREPGGSVELASPEAAEVSAHHDDALAVDSLRTKEDYPFTFKSSYRSSGNPINNKRPTFDPSLSPFATGEPSHSTLNGPSNRGKSSRPGLHLFRSTYDTYTREHLSALVDSIAIEPSPSPPVGSLRDDDRAWSSEGSPTGEGQSGPSSGSRTRPSDESDARSSKRMRMSPSSPARRAGGVRDWDAQARAVMDKIRGRAVESTTSASMSSPDKEDQYGTY